MIVCSLKLIVLELILISLDDMLNYLRYQNQKNIAQQLAQRCFKKRKNQLKTSDNFRQLIF